MTETEPTEERWAYGGIRLLRAERMFAWLPDAGSGEELLFRPMKGSYTVGLVYRVFVTRSDGRVVMHGWPRYANRRVEPGLAALLRAGAHPARPRPDQAPANRSHRVGRGHRAGTCHRARADHPRRPDRPHRVRRRGAV